MLRFSTGLRNKMLGIDRATIHAMMVANTISFNNGTSKILDSGSGFLTAGFLVGDKARALGTANNNTIFTITARAAGELTVTPAPVTEAAGSYFSLAAASGGTMRDVMRNGKLLILSGNQPANADAAIGSATLLMEYTLDNGAWVAGEPTNGINLAPAANGAITKESEETWKGKGLANGTAGWFRFVANPADNGLASTTLPRIDGSIGTIDGVDMKLLSTLVELDHFYYINSAVFTFPYQYGA